MCIGTGDIHTRHSGKARSIVVGGAPSDATNLHRANHLRLTPLLVDISTCFASTRFRIRSENLIKLVNATLVARD